MTHLLTMYFLDSGAYSKGFMNWFGFFVPTEYDWIHQVRNICIALSRACSRRSPGSNQLVPATILCVLNAALSFIHAQRIMLVASIDPIERPFTPDTAKDIGSIWERQAEGQVAPSARRLAKPNAVMFFHIPLYVSPGSVSSGSRQLSVCDSEESYAAADTDPISGKPLDVGLHDIEGHGSAKKQDGFFHKGLLQAMESDHRAGGNAREVKVVSNGHCHGEHCGLALRHY